MALIIELELLKKELKKYIFALYIRHPCMLARFLRDIIFFLLLNNYDISNLTIYYVQIVYVLFSNYVIIEMNSFAQSANMI